MKNRQTNYSTGVTACQSHDQLHILTVAAVRVFRYEKSKRYMIDETGALFPAEKIQAIQQAGIPLGEMDLQIAQ